MRLSLAERIKLVEESKSNKFTDLVELSGLDPAVDFRFHDLSKVGRLTKLYIKC